jgi:amino acid adenylation domain-containing protein
MEIPASFSASQRALIEKLRGARRPSTTAGPIPRLLPGSAIECSFAQQRLWILEQLNPGTPLYNVPLALRLRGPLDEPALDRALLEIINRHEALRTIFPEVDGSPVPRITATPLSLLQIRDLSPLTQAEQSAAIDETLIEQAERPFQLAEGPLLRALLLRIGPEHHLLAITMHHIVCDAWSMPVLLKELFLFYEKFTNGLPHALAELPVQYSDYAVWQRTKISGETFDRDVSYWRKSLEGASILELPLDHPRPRLAGWKGGTALFTLDAKTSNDLRALGQRYGASAFMTTLATFYALLFRYSGQSDIVVGCPVSNRSHSALEGLIGFFVNTLALRIQVTKDQSFLELLNAVRETAIGGFDHAELPFEKLVEELRIQRDFSRHPLFQVMFAWQNASPLKPANSPLSIELVDANAGAARFDLTILLSDNPGGIRGSLRYKTELFDHSTMERMVSYWQHLIASAIHDPGTAIGRLALLSKSEKRELIEDCNATKRIYEDLPTIVAIIEQQAAEHAEAEAVRAEGGVLSYGELDGLANQVAHALRSQGVGTEVRVGVCLERGLEMVVALLGVMKAGGAYVPMEPGYPAERLGWIAEDAGIKVVISQRRWAERLGNERGRVWLDGWEEIAKQPKSGVEKELTGDNLAYVIYTSGSTGRPKGAMNTHRGIRNRLLWMQEYFGLESKDVVLQKTPFSFDVSVWEFFWPLMMGARLVMARPGGHQDSGYLVEVMEREQVSTVHFVPSMLDVFLEEEDVGERCGSLRRVICSGEALSRSLQERFEKKLGCGLYNLYGPTEAAVDVTVWECERGSQETVVPIGRPIANTQVYVLDEYGEPAPVGTTGEVYLGGEGLGRGYLGRADWTAERWVPDSLGGTAGARLYRTGDVGKRRADGAVEYIGRGDQQVKLRGFRIELGEIEEALRGCAGVREAAVAVKTEGGEGRLVGYVVGEKELGLSELRVELQRRLPEYMVPSAMMRLESLPLSPNGKLDRKALPTPDAGQLQLDQPYDAPRDTVEIELCRLWEEALRVPGIGIHQNFFELGGHSLMAVSLVNKIRQRFSVRMAAAAIFEAPTVAQLATRIRDTAEHRHRVLLPYRTTGTRPPFFCVHAASGTVLAYAPLARHLSTDQPFYGIQAQGVEGEAEPLTTVHEMAARYLPEVRATQPHGPYTLGGWSLGGHIALEMARTLGAEGETVSLVALFDAIVPLGFDGEARHGARDAKLILKALLGRLSEADPPPNLNQLSTDEQLELVIETERKLGRVPPEYRIDELRTQLRVLNINLNADLQYRPEPYSGRVVLFRASDAIGNPCDDPDGGWRELVPALETCLLPGDHYSMLLDPENAVVAARELDARLAQVAEALQGKACSAAMSNL